LLEARNIFKHKKSMPIPVPDTR